MKLTTRNRCIESKGYIKNSWNSQKNNDINLNVFELLNNEK